MILLPQGSKGVPGVSMTLKKWCHYPKRGYDGHGDSRYTENHISSDPVLYFVRIVGMGDPSIIQLAHENVSIAIAGAQQGMRE